MRQDVPQRHSNRIWLGLLCVSVLSALLLVLFVGHGSASSPSASAVAPDPFQQLAKPWTAIGSTGVMDEASVGLFGTAGSSIGFKLGVAGNTLVARYNVTNTFDNNANPNRPGWRTLEMGSVAPTNVIIEAKLFQVRACQTAQVLLCTARNRSNDFPCARCDLSATPVDFTNDLFFIELRINRANSPNTQPRMFTLRLL